MAGTEDITSDVIDGPQVPLCALRANAVKLLEVEERNNEVLPQEIELEKQAKRVISEMYKSVFSLLVCSVGIFYQTTKVPSTNNFAISILLMCLFLAGVSIHTGMSKTRITRKNMLLMFWIGRHQRVRVEARILMELENNRKRRLAANFVDTSEGPVITMDSFITRTKTIYDAPDFFDFEKIYHKKINLCWVLGGVYLPAMLVLTYFFLW